MKKASLFILWLAMSFLAKSSLGGMNFNGNYGVGVNLNFGLNTNLWGNWNQSYLYNQYSMNPYLYSNWSNWGGNWGAQAWVPRVSWIPRVQYYPYVSYVPASSLYSNQYFNNGFNLNPSASFYWQQQQALAYQQSLYLRAQMNPWGMGNMWNMGYSNLNFNRFSTISPIAPIAPIAPMGYRNGGSYRSTWWCCDDRSCKDSGKKESKQKETHVVKNEKTREPVRREREEVPSNRRPKPAPAPNLPDVTPRVVKAPLKEPEIKLTLREFDPNQYIKQPEQPTYCEPVREPAEEPVFQANQCQLGKDDYLEKDLHNFNTKMGWKDNGEGYLASENFPVSCIQGAMQRMSTIFPKGKSTVGYVSMSGYTDDDGHSCGLDKTGAIIDLDLSAPCISNTYLTATYNSYVQASQCLGLDPRELFPQLAHESGFHANIGNWTNANKSQVEGLLNSTGVGQLTGSAIADVNDAGLFNQVLNSSNPACAGFKKVIASKMRSNVKLNCDRFLISDGNPAKNILYTGLFYKLNKAEVGGKVARALDRSWKSADSQIIDYIVRLSYNSGRDGATISLENYLAKNPSPQSFEEFKAGFESYLANSYRYAKTNQRRREVAGYVSSIESTGQKIEESLGLSGLHQCTK